MSSKANKNKMNLAASLKSLRKAICIQANGMPWYMLLLVLLFTSCTEKEDLTEISLKSFIGTYKGAAQVSWFDYGNTYTRKDSTFTDVQVSIQRSTENSKNLTVTVTLPTGSVRTNLNVSVSGNKLSYQFSARGCGCTHSISGEMNGSALKLSLYDYESSVTDTRMSVQANKE